MCARWWLIKERETREPKSEGKRNGREVEKGEKRDLMKIKALAAIRKFISRVYLFVCLSLFLQVFVKDL